jgi:hypothetical protein
VRIEITLARPAATGGRAIRRGAGLLRVRRGFGDYTASQRQRECADEACTIDWAGVFVEHDGREQSNVRARSLE